MIDPKTVLEYLNKHPGHSTWQMRLHFLQATQQLDSKSSVSISSIANQLNYILRDLEASGKIPPQIESSARIQNIYQSEYRTNASAQTGKQE
jgi:hypothetical protein